MLEAATHGVHALGHPGEPEPAVRGRCGRRAGAVVGDLDDKAFGRVAQRHGDVVGVAVSHHVGQRLLHDAVGRELCRARQLDIGVVVVEGDLDARGSCRFGQLGTPSRRR